MKCGGITLERTRILKSKPEQVEPGFDHLPDIKANMKVNGKLIQFHEKWLIAEVEQLRKKIDEVSKYLDKHKEAV